MPSFTSKIKRVSVPKEKAPDKKTIRARIKKKIIEARKELKELDKS